MKIRIVVFLCMFLLIACTREEEKTDPLSNNIQESDLEEETQETINEGGNNIKSEPTVALGKYIRDLDYSRTFKTQSIVSGEVSLSALEGLYTDDELMKSYSSLTSDLELLAQFKSFEDNITIYVLEETIDGGTYVVNGKIFTTSDDFENGTYLQTVIKVVYDIGDSWICIGLNHYIQNIEEDVNILGDYYRTCENMNILGLLEPRFLEDYNTKEEIEIAKMTSISLVDYIMNEYGFDRLVDGNVEVLKQEWLNTIDVDKEYHHEYMEVISEVRFEYSSNCDIKATFDEDIYYIVKMDPSMLTSDDIEKYLFREILWKETFVNELIEEAPNYYETYYKNQPKETWLGSTREKSRAGWGTISLARLLSYAHEDVHIWLEHAGYGFSDWDTEGLAEYFSKLVIPDEISYDYEWMTDVYNGIFDLFDDGTYDITDRELITYYYYDKYYNREDDLFDYRLHLDSIAYTELLVESGIIGERHTRPIYKNHDLTESERKQGDELSYTLAASFMAFLVDEYTLDVVLFFSHDAMSYEEGFGKSYDELRADWMEYLRREETYHE